MEKEDTYRIYDYFKGHPGVLLTCISAFLAAGSFATSLLLYLINYRYYKYWNIYPDISLEGGSGRYLILISFFLMMIETIYAACLESVVRPFCDGIRTIHKMDRLRSLVKDKVQIYRQNKQRARKLEGRQKEHERGENGAVQSDEDSIDNLGSEIEDLIQSLHRDIRGLYRRMFWFCLKQAARNLFVPFLVFQMTMVGFWITFRNLEDNANTILLLLPIILSLILFLLEVSFAFLDGRNLNKDDFDLEDQESWNELLNLADELTRIEYPKDTMRKHGFRSVLSDRVLKKHGFNIVSSIAISTFALFLVLMTGTRKTYAIAEYNDKDYAIVYQNLERSILEPAIIDGDTLQINASRQVIVDSAQLDFNVRKFREVIKLEETNKKTEYLSERETESESVGCD